jgi:IclR family mhp operon transcriptional activator
MNDINAYRAKLTIFIVICRGLNERRSLCTDGFRPAQSSPQGRRNAMEKGVPIRSISRSICVMQAINRHGSLTLMEISQQAKVPYPTACRIVQTLLVEGLLEREPNRKRYRPTALVHTLSHGFQDDDRLVSTARPLIVALTKKIAWPVTITTRVGQKMMVRDSTHTLTSLTFNNYYPGYTLPILECATGRAYLAFCSDEERENVLDSMKAIETERPVGAEVMPFFESGLMVKDIRAQGFATKGRNPYTENPGKTSSIAIPLFDGEELVGSLAVVFFSVAMKMEKAIETFLPDMQRTAGEISIALSGSARRAA